MPNACFIKICFPFSFTVGFINISCVALNLSVTEFCGLNKLVFIFIHIDVIFQVQRKRFPRRTSYGVYISQLIRFARASSNLNDFNYRNKDLTAKLLRQGYHYFKLRKAFSKFYRRHCALLEKYSVSLKTLLQQGISGPEFYCDLVYRFKKKL